LSTWDVAEAFLLRCARVRGRACACLCISCGYRPVLVIFQGENVVLCVLVRVRCVLVQVLCARAGVLSARARVRARQLCWYARVFRERVLGMLVCVCVCRDNMRVRRACAGWAPTY
jgi:hypothetical protein